MSMIKQRENALNQNSASEAQQEISMKALGDVTIDVFTRAPQKDITAISGKKQAIVITDVLVDILADSIRQRKIHHDNLFSILKYLPTLPDESVTYLVGACVHMEYAI